MAKAEIQVKTGDNKLTVREQQKSAKMDIAKAIKMRAKGNTLQEIADIQGVSKTAIHKGLAPYKEHLDNLTIYRDNRDSLQDMAASKCLTTLLKKDMESEKASSVAAAFKVFNDASRLERGESTSNIAIKVVDLTDYQGQNES